MTPEEENPFVRHTSDDVLDPIWENAFGDGTQEMYRVALSPADNWGSKGPHVMFSLTSGTSRCYSEEYAAVSFEEAKRLHKALTRWLLKQAAHAPTRGTLGGTPARPRKGGPT